MIDDEAFGPPQVKCRLKISSIFDAMNFQHFSENVVTQFTGFPKDARNELHQKC